MRLTKALMLASVFPSFLLPISQSNLNLRKFKLTKCSVKQTDIEFPCVKIVVPDEIKINHITNF